jgi:hypothetical protein
MWRLDLSLHDLHQNVTAFHEALRDSITDEQRAAVLRIKDVWFRLPSYPDEIGGFEIYSAFTEGGVRTPEQFRGWLADHGLLRNACAVVESGAKREPQVAGLAEDATQCEREPRLSAAAKIGNLVR